MLDCVLPASLEQVDEAHKVTVNVGVGVLQGVAHTGLRRQVHDPLNALLMEKPLQRATLRNIQRNEMEVCQGLELRQAGLLQGDIIIVVEIVDTDHLAALLKQALGDMKTDKTRCARN